jgi:hypothetical protein
MGSFKIERVCYSGLSATKLEINGIQKLDKYFWFSIGKTMLDHFMQNKNIFITFYV